MHNLKKINHCLLAYISKGTCMSTEDFLLKRNKYAELKIIPKKRVSAKYQLLS